MTTQPAPAQPVVVITRFPSRHDDGRDGAIREVIGPFVDDDAARAWAEATLDPKIMWTWEDIRAPRTP